MLKRAEAVRGKITLSDGADAAQISIGAPVIERVAILLAQYAEGRELIRADIVYLRESVTRGELEALATGPMGGTNASRRLFKLCNVLFQQPGSRRKPPPANPSAPGMYPTLKNVKAGIGGRSEVSGGGANGTGKKR